MKTKIISTKEKEEFKPFTLEINVETIQEARLLFHVFNHARLLDGITAPHLNYRFDGYSDDVCHSFGDNTYSKIEQEIENQGFNI